MTEMTKKTEVTKMTSLMGIVTAVSVELSHNWHGATPSGQAMGSVG